MMIITNTTTTTIRSQFHRSTLPKTPPKPAKLPTLPLKPTQQTTRSPLITTTQPKLTKNITQNTLQEQSIKESSNGYSRIVLIGAASMSIFVILMGFDTQKALAFGPEGPLMEEFWDNMRRYVLYALTVSTGFAYTLLQPLYELLKNPVSAVVVVVVVVGGFYVLSSVLSAMFGVTDFSYDYGY